MHHFEKSVEALLRLNFEHVEMQPKVPWRGLFGQTITPDFIVDNRLCFEVKYQAVQGSVEQKIVYAVEQICFCHKLPTWLVYAGDGWSKGALRWLGSQKPEASFLGTLNLNQFLKVLQNG